MDEPGELVETDPEILELIRKSLAQEYTRLMAGLFRDSLAARAEPPA